MPCKLDSMRRGGSALDVGSSRRGMSAACTSTSTKCRRDRAMRVLCSRAGRAIGAIELFESFALVEVPNNMSEKVIRALRHTTIRGRKIAPSIARPPRR